MGLSGELPVIYCRANLAGLCRASTYDARGAIILFAMRSARHLRLIVLFCFVAAPLASLFFLSVPSLAQAQARRLILKDGSYQSVTKYEVKSDRVRYFSAERGEWEEVPNSLVDWDATNKFEQGRSQYKLAPEAVELDKQLEAERKAEQARSPQVAPGLRLPDDSGVFLLDAYQNQAQLVELQQSGGEVENHTKAKILRSAVNPLAGARQTVELPGSHAKIQSHTLVPSLYLNIGAGATASTSEADPLAPAERFKLVRMEIKGGKRIAGSMKTGVTGKTKSDARFVASTVSVLTGGWVKVTPSDPLSSGEYAVAEMLGKEGMNVYVWDFGVNPSAAANASAWKPEAGETKPKADEPAEIKKREDNSRNF